MPLHRLQGGVGGDKEGMEMVKAARQKLRSQAGLSLFMAVLVFLVCMAVCSVVITAATASAGRLSQLAKMDRRYYSVTSAAELLCSQVEAGPVVLTQEEGGELTCASDSLMVRLTKQLIEGGSAAEITFTPRDSDNKAQLKAKGQVDFYPSPRRGMTITLTNDNGEDVVYALKLDCTADVLQTTGLSGGKKIDTYTVTWSVTGLSR